MSKYSKDLRERVVAFIENGGKKLEASRRFNVGRPAIDRWLKLKQTNGHLEDRPPLPRSWRKLNREKLLSYVAENPDLMLKDYASHFQTSASGVCRALKRLKITLKKRPLSTEKEMRRSAPYFWSK